MSDLSGLLGQKLLQGWTMLEEGCDKCDVPLMREPRGTALVCVGCGPVSSEPDPEPEPAPAPRQPEPVPVVEAAAPQPPQRNPISVPVNENCVDVQEIQNYLFRASQQLNQFPTHSPAVEQLGKNMVVLLDVLERVSRTQ